MIIFNCKQCNKECSDIPSVVKHRKYCSLSCATTARNLGNKHSQKAINNMRRAKAWKYIDEVVKDYKNGATIISLVKKYKTNKKTIRTILQEQGITMRGRKGITAWNKGLKGFMYGEINGRWKGDNVGYNAIHAWVVREKGKPKKCLHCKATKKLQWANIDHKYSRNLKDYIPLCVFCHYKYDKKHNLRR